MYPNCRALPIQIHFRLIIVLSLIFSFSLQAQEHQSDSTAAYLIHLKEESVKLTKESKHEEAIQQLEKALKIYQAENVNDDQLIFSIYVDLSNLYGHESIREQKKSDLFVEKAEALIGQGKLQKKYDVVNFYISIGANQLTKKFPEKALGYITKAEDYLNNNFSHITTEVGLSEARLLKLNLLEWYVSIYQRLETEAELVKAYNALENYYRKYAEIDGFDSYYALASFRMGRYYQADNVEKAVYYFDKAEEKGDENTKLYALICKGFAYLSAEDYSGVPKIVQKLSAFNNLNRFQKLNIHEIAGRLYSEKGNVEKLVFHTNQALNLLNAKETPVDVLNFNTEDFEPIEALQYPILLNQFAYFIEGVDHPELKQSATKLYRVCLEQYANRIDRKPIDNAQHRKNIGIIKNRMFHYISSKETSLNEKKEILAYFENLDNRAKLNSLLSNRAMADKTSQLDDYLSREKKLREDLTVIKQQQQSLDTLLPIELSQLEVELSEIQNKIKQENPSFFKLNTAKFTFDQLVLDQSTFVLLFEEADGELFRTLVSQDQISTEFIGDYHQIEALIDDFLVAIKTPKNLENFEQLSHQLYKILLNGIEPSPHLIIKADESLINIPFELLKNKDRFLIEQSSIAYTNGLLYLNKSLEQDSQTKTTQTSLAHFYVPTYDKFAPAKTELAVRGEPYKLAGAVEEVKALTALVGGEIYDREQASKANFFKTANNTSIIHFAGHAYLNNADPELSYIALSDTEKDNQLFLIELYALKSNADLAVLSACNTGVGGYQSGKGIVSLSDAFMYSGIPSTLSSLWSAPDQSTKDIMIGFYENLSQGQSKSEALQQAKLSYLNRASNPKLKHPYYWAGFVLYGDDSPIAFEQNALLWYDWALLALALVLLGILIYKLIRPKKQA